MNGYHKVGELYRAEVEECMMGFGKGLGARNPAFTRKVHDLYRAAGRFMERDIAIRIDGMLLGAQGNLDSIAHYMKHNLPEDEYSELVKSIGQSMYSTPQVRTHCRSNWSRIRTLRNMTSANAEGCRARLRWLISLPPGRANRCWWHPT